MENTYIIAEMACSHDGEKSLAKTIIDGAGKANANAIQFQIWKLDEMMAPNHPDYNSVKKLELKRDQWAELFDYSRTKYRNMDIIACVYEKSSIDFGMKLGVDAFKLHSSDLSNPKLIKHLAITNKRIDLSVGASTLDEIRKAIEWIHTENNHEIYLMYGLQNFPTPTHAIHLKFINTLKRLFDLPIGYQDHSDADKDVSFWLPAAAIGFGANIIEKHITYDRKQKGADYNSALNPDEYKCFVEMIRIIDEAKGDSKPRAFSPEEIRYRKYAKKSIVAARHMIKGERICEEDLLYMRTGELGYPPDNNHKFIGKKVIKEIQAYDLLNELMIEI